MLNDIHYNIQIFPIFSNKRNPNFVFSYKLNKRIKKQRKKSLRRFTYENLVTTSPTSRKSLSTFYMKIPIGRSDGQYVQKAVSNSKFSAKKIFTRHS